MQESHHNSCWFFFWARLVLSLTFLAQLDPVPWIIKVRLVSTRPFLACILSTECIRLANLGTFVAWGRSSVLALFPTVCLDGYFLDNSLVVTCLLWFKLFSNPAVEETWKTPTALQPHERRVYSVSLSCQVFTDLQRAQQRNSLLGNSQSTLLVEYSESPSSIAQFQLSAFSGNVFSWLAGSGIWTRVLLLRTPMWYH